VLFDGQACKLYFFAYMAFYHFQKSARLLASSFFQ